MVEPAGQPQLALLNMCTMTETRMAADHRVEGDRYYEADLVGAAGDQATVRASAAKASRNAREPELADHDGGTGGTPCACPKLRWRPLRQPPFSCPGGPVSPLM